MCLGVESDSALTFAPHVRRVSGKSSYHLRQLKIVLTSLSEAAAKTTMHAFITSRLDYCNSVLSGVSAVHLRPLRNVRSSAARITLSKQITSLLTFATSCQFNGEYSNQSINHLFARKICYNKSK